jgi:glycosyltransferase involved in cell wall biosynthesis
MKILFHHRIASLDGQSVHMEELIGALRDQCHDVVLVGPERVGEENYDASMVARLKRSLPTHLYETLEFGYNALSYRRLRAAYLTHRPDVIYERYNLYTLAGVWLRRAYSVPLLAEVNAPLVEERARHGGLAFPRLAAWTERTVWREADYVLPVTQVLADYVRRAGVPDERIVVIPNGIDPQCFADAPDRAEAKRRLGLEGRVVLGFTGFLKRWHQLDRVVDLLAAESNTAPSHLLVVGDGPHRTALQSYARQRGVADRVTVTGVVAHDAIPAHVAAFDIALQPGVTPYASPLKLFEYMALGCAIVAPDTPNIREVLTCDINALLFCPDQPESFAAVVEHLARDPALRDRLGAAARANITEKKLTWSHNAERVTALCRSLLTSDPHARRQRVARV